jgi:hypothetical protein
MIGTPHTHNAGYLINNKDDPRTRHEADIQTCPHCQAVIDMQAWAKASVQNFCMKCMRPACNDAACQDCVPFMRKIEQSIKDAFRALNNLRVMRG